LEEFRKTRSSFYENLRRSNSCWANGARAVLAILGAIALFLTALVAALRLAPETLPSLKGTDADKVVLLGVLVIYAIMAAINFYEKGSDKTTSYFRQIATILAIRDLWTRVQFAILKELVTLKNTADATATDATRAKILELAESFCVDVDKVATGELGEFKT